MAADEAKRERRRERRAERLSMQAQMEGNGALVADASDEEVLAEGDGAGANGREGNESALDQLDSDEYLQVRMIMQSNQNRDITMEADFLSCTPDLL